ncbi:MAG TPA: hypothetical protein VFR85_06795 [Anaeromyxobacteraceae bacterium]|nr:hypothetical protein [Anaeromyxobacteraceae bacterium]
MSSPASALPETAPAHEPEAQLPSEVVVGIPAGPEAERFAAAVLDEARRVLPGRAVKAVPLPRQPTVVPGSHLAADGALPGLLRLSLDAGASACAWLGGAGDSGSGDRLGLLLGPILEGGLDFVCASYRRGPFEGALTTALVYPLTRALHGVRLRQPLGAELALSRRLGERLAADADWTEDPARAGADLWVASRAVAGGFGVGQAFLGPYPGYLAEPEGPPSESLARVAGTVFRDMERTAGAWQRVRGSRPVPTSGESAPLPGSGHPPSPTPLIGAFELGCHDLLELWGAILPPATLVALRRAARQPAASFRFDDGLWARSVYDFALGHRQRVLDRGQLLRSLTPIYLGWLAGFVAECGALDPAGVEGRVERLCLAFEAEKPYLISRWRWPDRFNP